MKINTGSICNYFAALLLLAMGLVYLLKGSVMPNHLDALQTEWTDIEPNVQVLLLALMRGIAGGFITLSIAIIYLQRKFVQTRSPWIPGLILVTGIIVSLA